MPDRTRPDDKKPSEEKPGKFHYNPVGMAGQKAGIVEEIAKEEADESKDAQPAKSQPTPAKPKSG